MAFRLKEGVFSVRCRHPGCPTLLSRYNNREFCYAHAPTRFPRLRGRVVRET